MSTTIHNLKKILLAATFVLVAETGAQAADINAIDFESYALGDLPGDGGPDNRTAGDDTTWWVPSNAATSAEVRAGVGFGGSQGLVIGNRGNGLDGTIDNVKSPRLAESAGETGTNSGVGGTAASNPIFRSEYSFRTASDTPVDGFEFTTETWGPDRNTYLLFSMDSGFGETSLTAYYADYQDATGDFQSFATNLNFGEWYRVVTEVEFVDGASNDSVDHFIYDSSNALVASVTDVGTWEEGQRQNGFNGGNVFSVDAIQFQARNGGGGVPLVGDVAFVDNLNYSVVPEPASIALLGLAAGSFFVVRRRRRG